jgi:hypothetical protein
MNAIFLHLVRIVLGSMVLLVLVDAYHSKLSLELSFVAIVYLVQNRTGGHLPCSSSFIKQMIFQNGVLGGP